MLSAAVTVVGATVNNKIHGKFLRFSACFAWGCGEEDVSVGSCGLDSPISYIIIVPLVSGTAAAAGR